MYYYNYTNEGLLIDFTSVGLAQAHPNYYMYMLLNTQKYVVNCQILINSTLRCVTKLISTMYNNINIYIIYMYIPYTRIFSMGRYFR